MNWRVSWRGMRRVRRAAWLAGFALLAGCTRPAVVAPVAGGGSFAADQHLPPYVRMQFEPLSAVNTVAIAEREWRAFGSVVDDAPPGPDIPGSLRLDKQAGLWQRVSDYWWSSQDYGNREGGFGSRYTEGGTAINGTPVAWSAAFISYVMRTAGAGPGFPYTPLHADYINAAARREGVLRAERPETYAPQLGDLICVGRLAARQLKFDDLPSGRFFAHCDLVVSVVPGQLSVIGGNVSAGVTMKHVPTTPSGMLADASAQVVDGRYGWFVVLRVLYGGASS